MIGSAPITICISLDQPAPANHGSPALSASRLVARVSRCAMNAWPVCSIRCASPAVMARITNASPPLAKTDLLILDDFGLKPLTQPERLDLLELIDDRHGRRSTLLTSQLPIAHWHAYLGDDPTVADALLDRLLSAAHRLELKGESMRKRRKIGKSLTAKRPKQ